MKRVIHKRAKRSKNGTTMWKITTMDAELGKTSTRKVRASYDEITTRVHRIRSRNESVAVCAEEMNRIGTALKEDGKVVALDSIEDERMFEETIKKLQESIDDEPYDISDYL